MCVIVFCQKTRINNKTIDVCFEKNKDGIGVAWVKDKKVWYKKGIDIDELRQLAQTLPLPYTIHFRKATVGSTSKSLNHPFPISPDADPLDLEGEGTEGVLFHNGTVSTWREDLKSLLLNSTDIRLPDGEWSDSRAMAYLCFYGGFGLCNLYTEKNRFLLYTSEGTVKKYGGWFYMPTYFLNGKEEPKEKIKFPDDYDTGIQFSKNLLQ